MKKAENIPKTYEKSKNIHKKLKRLSLFLKTMEKGFNNLQIQWKEHEERNDEKLS